MIYSVGGEVVGSTIGLPGEDPASALLENPALLVDNPYGDDFRGKIDVALHPRPEGPSHVVVSPYGKRAPKTGPLVRQFDLDGLQLDEFFAFQAGFKGGVMVATGDFGKGTQLIVTTANLFAQFGIHKEDEPYRVLRRPDYVSPTSMAGVCS